MIADLIKKAAGLGLPLLGSALAGPAGGAVGSMLSKKLGIKDDPASLLAAMNDPSNLRAFQEAESDMAKAAARTMEQANKTYRKELESKDGYVRRMRPTFGYVTAFCFLLIVGVGAYTLVANPGDLGLFAQFVEALSGPLVTATGVLGVYVHGRSSEKKAASGQPGLLQSLLKR